MKTMLSLAVLTTACTTLGPMPATTGISAIPNGRPGLEAQAGIMPAYYLSSAASDQATGEEIGTQQLAAVIEPDRLLGTKGLILGARAWGDDSAFEPMLGMRRKLDDTFAIAGVVYGTQVSGESTGATYSATRFGGEVTVDALVLPVASWLAVHAQATVSATHLRAHGRYCVDPTGDATDCELDGKDHFVTAELEGIYPAATASVSLDLARRPTGELHGVRVALIAATGGMPRVRDGVQERGDTYRSIGMSLTLGLGSDR
jgi:hypothetical protein